MSSVFFPCLPGMTWDIAPIPTWSTVKQMSRRRARTALQNDPYPLWTFELSFEFLRDSNRNQLDNPYNPAGYTELEQIVGFYNARGGDFDSFLLDPGMLTLRPNDSRVSGAPVGVGDGVTTVFYLQRDAGGFLDEVQAPVGTIILAVNNVIQPASTWSLGPAGVVSFAAAPAANAVITWDGSWAWNVAFVEPELGLKQFMYELYELQSLKLEQVKL